VFRGVNFPCAVIILAFIGTIMKDPPTTSDVVGVSFFKVILLRLQERKAAGWLSCGDMFEAALRV